ncbi:MAG TPA: ABC transporter permease [Actinomycetota bacterium]|nr:ABC transporter permease [Actinomycetota bacterium]
MAGKRILDWNVAIYGYAGLVALLLIVPTLIVIPMSFSAGGLLTFPPTRFSIRWYGTLFDDPSWTAGLVTSLKVGVATAGLATSLGTVTALGLVRGRYPGRAAISGLVMSPLVTPVVVVAIGMFFVYSDWKLIGTFHGLVLAHTALALPLVVIVVGASLQNLDPALEVAARSLGAGPVRTFLRITLPLTRPSIVTGALFAFITSWDEVVVSIFLSSPVVRTLPVVMWGQVRSVIEPTIAAMATVLTGVTFGLLMLVLLPRKRAQRIS